MRRAESGEWVPDDFDHEQNLIVEEYGKRVLFVARKHLSVRRERRIRQAEKKVKTLETKIAELEQQLADIEDKLSTATSEDLDVYYSHSKISRELEEVMAQWEKAGEELERARS